MRLAPSSRSPSISKLRGDRRGRWPRRIGPGATVGRNFQHAAVVAEAFAGLVATVIAVTGFFAGVGVAWPAGAAVESPLILSAVDGFEDLPVIVRGANRTLPPLQLRSTDRFPQAATAGTPSWLPESTVAAAASPPPIPC